MLAFGGQDGMRKIRLALSSDICHLVILAVPSWFWSRDCFFKSEKT